MKPATIKSARFDYDGVTVVLVIRIEGQAEDCSFALNETDQNGLSPFLREELAAMLEADAIAIEPAPVFEEGM
jgi:hypothetical protein